MHLNPVKLAKRLRARYAQVSLMNPELKGFGAYANWALSNAELLAGVERIRARPLKLTFDPTNVCQLRCPMCPTGLGIQDRPHGHASLEMFERLLDELGSCLFLIDFCNWGEPLLNTHLEEFIELASARRIVCSMSTNLSLPLTDARIERLVRSGLNELIVAADGATRESYATYRRRGNFDLVCENMRRIVAAKRQARQPQPLIAWHYLVFRFNEDQIGRAREMAAQIGVDRLELKTPFLDVDRYPMWTAKEPVYQIAPLTRAAAAKKHSRCGWHYTSTAINWDGSVAPCCGVFEKHDDFGSLTRTGAHSYMEVVNNDSFRSVRRRFAGKQKDPTSLVCERCPTPLIMDYHKSLNHQIALISLVAFVQRLRRFLGFETSLYPQS